MGKNNKTTEKLFDILKNKSDNNELNNLDHFIKQANINTQQDILNVEKRSMKIKHSY